MHKVGQAGKVLMHSHLHTSSLIFLLVMKNKKLNVDFRRKILWIADYYSKNGYFDATLRNAAINFYIAQLIVQIAFTIHP